MVEESLEFPIPSPFRVSKSVTFLFPLCATFLCCPIPSIFGSPSKLLFPILNCVGKKGKFPVYFHYQFHPPSQYEKSSIIATLVYFFWSNLDSRTNRFQEEGNDTSSRTITNSCQDAWEFFLIQSMMFKILLKYMKSWRGWSASYLIFMFLVSFVLFDFSCLVG